MVSDSRSRKRSRPADQSSIDQFYSSKRMRWHSSAYKGKYAVRRRSVSRRRTKNTRNRRKVLRTRRRPRRSRGRSNTFAARVAYLTSQKNVITRDDTAVIRNAGGTGKALVEYGGPVLSFTLNQLIQSRLNQDEVVDSSNFKDYNLVSANVKFVYTNSASNKVLCKVYKYRVRFDNNVPIPTTYVAGFTNDGSLLADDPSSTPFMSSNFCCYNKITKTYSKWLEQGESITINCRAGPKHINSDRYYGNSNISGSEGFIMMAVGNLGYDTTLAVPTTGNVELLLRYTTVLQYTQMADNAKRNYSAATIPAGSIANFRHANADTGLAITGPAGDIA